MGGGLIWDINTVRLAGVPDGSAPVAIVDIGSNSIRLVIYEGLTRAPYILYNEKVQVGLGASVARSGQISAEALERADGALRRFRFLADQAGVKTLYALATAAAREASNGEYFISMACDLLGSEIRLLSGREEAYFAALGVKSSFRDPVGVVGDMGGGSLELLKLDQEQDGDGITLPLGGLRLVHDAGGNVRKAGNLARKALESIDALKDAKKQDFFAVGGTWRNIAMLYMVEAEHPLQVVHDFQIEAAALKDFCKHIQTGKLDNLKGIGSVSGSRKNLLPTGAAVLNEVVRAMSARRVRFSAFGVREGFLSSFLDEETLKLDPLITAAYHFSVLRSRSSEHAVELCDWTDRALTCFGIDESEEEARLRTAACLLADIAWRAHPNYRGRQSLNIISHGDFVGIDHAGRAFLSLAAYYRNEGNRDEPLSEALLHLAGPHLVERARILGGLLRLSYLFSASMPNVLGQLSFRASKKGEYAIGLPKSLASLAGERPRRRARQLGNVLGADLIVEIAH